MNFINSNKANMELEVYVKNAEVYIIRYVIKIILKK
ncbi:hypothetical protein ES703_46828 [subsurface metagenome]